MVLFGFFVNSCAEPAETAEVAAVKADLIHDSYPEAEAEVRLTMDSIAQSAKDGNVDRLIAFHAYGPKFTEFKQGGARNNGEVNEKFEREVFGSVTEIPKFNMNDMKIAAYGDVANVTLHTDFHMIFGEDSVVVNDQVTLLFVRTDKGWKIVHEHHSPLSSLEAEPAS